MGRENILINIMSTEKRKVSTDALETLGNIISEGAGRDAIHLAVEPVEAGEYLSAGDHIGFLDGKASSRANKKLGIVDPFITGSIQPGQKFWLIVYPRQITSLRHVWEHPDFVDKQPVEEGLSEIDKSKAWIKNFADRIRQHPDSLMDAAERWAESEDYTYDNSESYKEHWEEFPEFWRHYEIVTGKTAEDKSSFFTCSC